MTASDYIQLTRQFVDAQLRANRHEALRLVVEEGLDRGAEVRDVLLHVVRPAQEEIGRLWQDNRITVADEHAATAIAQLVLAHLFGRATPRSPTHRRILVACVEGELHDLGARMAADLLELEGHDVCFLGANVPTESLVEVVTREGPDLVVLSITMAFHGEALVRAIDALAAAVRPSPAVAAGGAGFAACRARLGQRPLVAAGDDAAALVESVAVHFLSRREATGE